MRVYDNVLQLIGNTPILKLKNLKNINKLYGNLFAKLEFYNPAGSSKDRVALEMITVAEKEGLINKDTVIIEPTSGNTGIGLASVCASKGYRVILTMPETMSVERRKLLKAYGAEIVLTQGDLGIKGSVEKAVELSAEFPNSFIPSQFENKNNPIAHKNTTAVEIWDDMDGKIDFLVAGVGTGGTISGCGEYLKSKNPDVKIVAVEPFNSPLISKGVSGVHGLQGIGANFIPKTFNIDICDEIITVKEEEAYLTAREVALNEGILIGISSGAAIFAAKQIAFRKENIDKNIVVIVVDSGEKYLSTPLFE